MTLIRFTEDRYLPFVEEHKRISPFRGYRNMWRRYLEPRCDNPLREFRTVDGERILELIAKEHKLTSTTLAHIKALLSGIFRYAKRQGVINSENPMRDVVLPKGKPAGETYAYSLEEIMQMLHLRPEPAATIIAIAAFTGVRKGELRGLLLGGLRRRASNLSHSRSGEGMCCCRRLVRAKLRFPSSSNLLKS
jgi:integrase